MFRNSQKSDNKGLSLFLLLSTNNFPKPVYFASPCRLT